MKKQLRYSVKGDFWHCFGCGAGGDVIEYVQRKYCLSFKESLSFLGISEENPGPTTRVKIKRDIHQQKRKQKEAALKKQIQYWCDDFYFECLDVIESVEYALKKLSWDKVQEIADLIKRCSDYRYYIELMNNAFESKDFDTLYFVWEQNQ